MAKLKRKITLPPLPKALADHPRRGDLERVNLVADGGRDTTGEAQPQAVAVWRLRPGAGVRALPVALQPAVLRWADLVEQVSGAGGAGLDPTGVRASGGLPAGPSLSRLQAAEQLRRLNDRLAAVDGLRIVVGASSIAQMRRGRAVTASARDLLTWLAVDGLSAAAMLRRAGIARATAGQVAELREAVLRAARALAL